MLYYESFPVIGDFCPKPFGQFYHIFLLRKAKKQRKNQASSTASLNCSFFDFILLCLATFVD